MPGPAPKPASQRQRRNRTTTAAILDAPRAAKIALPMRAWHPLTRDWWRTIWASPMADEWVDADVPGLIALAALIDAFWIEPDAKLHAEIRMASREFGLSPLSRRQLQWEIRRLEQVATAAVKAPRRPRDPQLRALSA